MPTFVTESDLPGAAALRGEQLRGMSKEVADVLAVIGNRALLNPQLRAGGSAREWPLPIHWVP
jgi:hypothetical protein